MPTSTPPPYFPQASLSPPDPKAALKKKLMFVGCLAVSLLLLAGFIVGLVYLIKWIF
ncbi:MAG: hypothetical protein QOF02_3078 [Blastocatellia bacterium]|jgi:hypothetical protein|nr:hypothetical protein [Blastocatellia bacterium]